MIADYLRPVTLTEIEEIAAEQLELWLADGLTPDQICAVVGEPWYGLARCTAGKALDAMVTAYRLHVVDYQLEQRGPAPDDQIAELEKEIA